MENDILKKKIEFLVEAYYNNFDFLRDEPLDSLKNKAVEKYLDSGLSFEQIQEKIEDEVIQRRKKSTSNVKEEEIDEDEKISKNHQDLYDTLEELAYLLRLADVNYYIEGGLVGYLNIMKNLIEFIIILMLLLRKKIMINLNQYVIH